MTTPAPLLVSVDEAAGLLSLSVRTVQSMVQTGEIASRLIRRRRRIPMSEILRLSAPGTVSGTTAVEVGASAAVFVCESDS